MNVTRPVTRGLFVPVTRTISNIEALASSVLALDPLAMWDFSPGTIFQDTAATIPATAHTDPIGRDNDRTDNQFNLLQPTGALRPTLDIALGNGRGPERVVNGDFSDGDTGWIEEANWDASGGSATKTPGAAGSLYQSTTEVVQGKTYEYVVRVSNYAGGVLTPFVRGTNTALSITADGTYTVSAVAGADAVYVVNLFADGSFSGEVELVELREVLRDGPQSIKSDGTQSMGSNVSGFTSDMYICYSMQSTDDRAIVFNGDGVGHWGGIFDQGSTSTAVTGGMGTPTLKVDGVVVVSPTRGDLYDLLADGVWHVVEFIGADMSAIEWQQFALFNYSGFRYDGNLGSFVIIPTPSDADQAITRNWTATKVGLSL